MYQEDKQVVEMEDRLLHKQMEGMKLIPILVIQIQATIRISMIKWWMDYMWCVVECEVVL